MLRFKPVSNFSHTNCFVEMQWCDQIKLPLVISHPFLSTFNCRTFSSLIKDSAIGAEYAFNPVNQFLETFTIEEQQTIANAYILMHVDIVKSGEVSEDMTDKTAIIKEIMDLESTLGDVLVKLDAQLDLCSRIKEFIIGNLPIADMKDAGTKPQHSKKMTFSSEESVDVTVLVMIMKFMTPLLGAFINKYRNILPSQKKEEHSYAIVTPLFKRRYESLMVKLFEYVQALLEKNHRSDITATYHGQTLEVSSKLLFAIIMTKRLVSVNLTREDGNIIRHISSCCDRGVSSYQANTELVKIITSPTHRMDSDEGNSSNLESESSQSAKSADTPILIKFSALQYCEKLAKKYNITKDELDNVISFYNNNNTIDINDISLNILANYYGKHIGGGAGVSILRYPELVVMIATLQLILAKGNSHHLLHALSFKIINKGREQTAKDYKFLANWKVTPEYGHCKKIFPIGYGVYDWNYSFIEMSEYLVQINFVYNTAPYLWELIGKDPCNGSIYDIDEYISLMSEIMILVSTIFTEVDTEDAA